MIFSAYLNELRRKGRVWGDISTTGVLNSILEGKKSLTKIYLGPQDKRSIRAWTEKQGEEAYPRILKVKSSEGEESLEIYPEEKITKEEYSQRLREIIDDLYSEEMEAMVNQMESYERFKFLMKQTTPKKKRKSFWR